MPTMGLDDAEYRQRASAAGKASILLWLVSGLLYNTYYRHLISISSLLLVVPGIFVVSLAALPVLWVDLLKDRILLRQRARRLQGQRRAADWVVLAVATPWWFISQLWPVGLAVLAARLLNGVGM
jgi:hypothetical protein